MSFLVILRRARRSGPVLVVLAACVAALALVLGPAGAAQAHNALVSTDPADGATLPQPPGQLVLTFNGDVLAVGTEVQLTGPSGPVGLEPVQVAGPVVTQPLPSGLPAGQYQAVWRVTSADGHPVDGRFSFSAAAGSTAAGAPSSPSAATTSGPTATSTAPPSSAAATPAKPAPSETGTGLSPLVWAVGGLAVIVVVAAALIGATRRRRR